MGSDTEHFMSCVLEKIMVASKLQYFCNELIIVAPLTHDMPRALAYSR